jgi:hypothetical protein
MRATACPSECGSATSKSSACERTPRARLAHASRALAVRRAGALALACCALSLSLSLVQSRARGSAERGRERAREMCCALSLSLSLSFRAAREEAPRESERDVRSRGTQARSLDGRTGTRPDGPAQQASEHRLAVSEAQQGRTRSDRLELNSCHPPAPPRRRAFPPLRARAPSPPSARPRRARAQQRVRLRPAQPDGGQRPTRPARQLRKRLLRSRLERGPWQGTRARRRRARRRGCGWTRAGG